MTRSRRVSLATYNPRPRVPCAGTRHIAIKKISIAHRGWQGTVDACGVRARARGFRAVDKYLRKIYQVGGSVRDKLLGLPASDRDYVVVGATVKEMLAAKFQPVGKDFPVFLHPKTKEEYALARTERKSGSGYTGFAFHASPEVTLIEDLQRRDLTINAMALEVRGDLIDPTDKLVDPFGGARDIEVKVFRHVSDAFAEDPLRVLRVARFAARFTDRKSVV